MSDVTCGDCEYWEQSEKDACYGHCNSPMPYWLVEESGGWKVPNYDTGASRCSNFSSRSSDDYVLRFTGPGKLTRATEGSAGFDLYTMEGGVIMAGARASVGTGVAVELPEDTVGLVVPRSGLARKHGITLVNSPGVIDSDYRGEIGVTLINHGLNAYRIEAGDRIAQLLVVPVMMLEPELVDSLSETARGSNGFGSSGR